MRLSPDRPATDAGLVAGPADWVDGIAALMLARACAVGVACLSVVYAVAYLAHSLPSPVDPRGLVAFGLAGLVPVAFGVALREEPCGGSSWREQSGRRRRRHVPRIAIARSS